MQKKMRSICILLIFFISLTLFSACGMKENTLEESASEIAQSPETSVPSTPPSTPPATSTKESVGSNVLNIEIGNHKFTATLEENPSAEAFKAMLPMTMEMGDMNSNEKYHYLQESLPTNPQRVGSVQNGDIMLYGSDCLVVFYEGFSTGYSYTKLGGVDNPTGLAEAMGSGLVTLNWSLGE